MNKETFNDIYESAEYLVDQLSAIGEAAREAVGALPPFSEELKEYVPRHAKTGTTADVLTVDEQLHKPRSKVERHKEACEFLNQLYKSKNEKYGDSFGRSVQKYGLIAALTRISDKFNRFEQLVLEGSTGTDDESLIDTCLDAANYFIMTAMELQNGGE